jgi:hypothetical protein
VEAADDRILIELRRGWRGGIATAVPQATTGRSALSADGQRILVIEGDRETSDAAIVVMDWSSAVQKR